MKLWVDDERPAPEGWTWAKTSEEAKRFLYFDRAFEYKIEEISFDHDLGGDDTTRVIVLWMLEHSIPWPPVVRVHTMNNVGRAWLEGMITRYAPPGTLQRSLGSSTLSNSTSARRTADDDYDGRGAETSSHSSDADT